MNDTAVDLQAMLKQAAESCLWGTIQFDFQDGQLVMIRCTETIKVSRENNRREHTAR